MNGQDYVTLSVAPTPGGMVQYRHTPLTVLLMMLSPALPFSVGALVTTNLNPLPVLIWFERVEWWLLICPAVFGILWPVAVGVVAVLLRSLPGRSGYVAGLATAAVLLNAAVFCVCARAGLPG